MATKDTVASLRLRIKDLEHEVQVLNSANEELGIKLRQQIARGNRLSGDHPPRRYAAPAQGDRPPTQMRLKMEAAREEAQRTGRSVVVAR